MVAQGFTSRALKQQSDKRHSHRVSLAVAFLTNDTQKTADQHSVVGTAPVVR